MNNEIITHEGVKYRKVARKAKVGEKILIVNAYMTGGRYRNNDVLMVKESIEEGNEYVGHVKVSEHPVNVNDREYVTLEPVADDSDIITVGGVKYRKVDRDASVGDTILIVNPKGAIDYRMGDTFVVTEIDEYRGEITADFIDNAGDKNGALREEYVVLERIATTDDLERELAEVKAKVSELEAKIAEHGAVSQQADEPLKVGDFAKVVDGSNGFRFGNGEIVKVTITDASKVPYYLESLDGSRWSWAYAYRVVRATSEEVAEAKRKLAQAEQPSLVVGDYVKVIANYGDLDVGSIGKVTEVDDDSIPYRIDLLDDSDYSWYKREHLEKISAEETAKAEEEAKWAKIGRKVNEYKKGDIVRVLFNRPKGSLHLKGVIGSITGIHYDDGRIVRFNVRTSLNDGYVHTEDVELIAPVESVVNLTVGGGK